MRFLILLGIASNLSLLGFSHPTESLNEEASLLAERGILQPRRSCDNAAGECVTYFADQNNQSPLGSYVPTCEGNCFQYSSFSSICTVGRAYSFTGTDCVIYSDNNCENQIADTGNHIATQCISFSQANSMRCYFNC